MSENLYQDTMLAAAACTMPTTSAHPNNGKPRWWFADCSTPVK